MGWEDREYEQFPRRSGGAPLGERIWRAIFRAGENPVMWGVPIARIARVLVRVSLLFILMAAVEMTTAAFKGTLAFVAMSMACLFVLVLLHEFGHITACRMVGGQADEILMWPLGGLAMCRPPHNWKANLWTTAGGPLVNVALAPVLALGVLAAGGRGEHLLFNYFEPGRTFSAFLDSTAMVGSSTFMTYAKATVWHLYYSNLALLAFNVLLPMFPMDGGRLWQEVLWSRMGYRRSMKIMTNVGLGCAVVVGLTALSTGAMTLMGLALFAGLICWNERQKLGATEAIAGEAWRGGREADEDDEEWRGGGAAEVDRVPRGADPFSAAVRKQQLELERQSKHQEEVDRILAKIAKSGMGSLSRSEKKTLEEETARKRGS
jgi:Zn-dependent protease